MLRLEFSVSIGRTAGVAQDRDDLPKPEKLSLALLHVSKGLRKARGRVLQTVGALSEQVVGGGVESVPEEQRSHINDPAAFGRVTSAEEGDEFLDMLLEDLRVDDAVPHEHGTDELAGARPEFSVRGKDAVAQEFLPLAVERLTLAVVGELPGQQGLDILGVHGHDGAGGNARVQLGGLDIGLASGCEDGVVPEFNVSVCQIGLLSLVDEVKGCRIVSVLCSTEY